MVLRKTGFILTIALLLALGSAHAVLADSCSMGRTPDGVYPVNDASITMVDEDVQVTIGEDGSTAAVDCHFTFKNAGEARDVLMGFPAIGPGYEDKESAPESFRKQFDALIAQDFKSYVDGSPVAVQEARGINPIGYPSGRMPYYSWYTFSVPFTTGETIEVRNTYQVQFSQGNAGFFAGYVLQTGKYWKGPIGHAKITFKMGDIQPYQLGSLYPNCYRFQGNDLVFERSNFKPDFDLRIDYYLDQSNLPQDYMKQFKKLMANISGMGQSELLQKYEEAVKENYPVMAAYILGRLPQGTVPNEPPHIADVNISKDPANQGAVVVANITDPDGDMEAAEFKVLHREENGKAVVDQDDRRPFGGCFYNFYTGGFDAYAQAYTDNFGPLVSGRDYLVVLTIWDSAGQSDSKVVSYQAEPGSLKASDSVVNAPAVPASASKTAAPDYFTLSITALVLLYFMVFFICRMKRR